MQLLAYMVAARETERLDWAQLGCSTCVALVDGVAAFLGQGRGASAEALLDSGCSLLPAHLEKLCEFVVDNYSASLAALLVQGVAGLDAC